MRELLKVSVAAGALLASTAACPRRCGIPTGSVRILSNDFEALHVVARDGRGMRQPDRQGDEEPDDRAQEHPGRRR